MGVLDSARTATSALVSFENGEEYQLHRFVEKGGEWRSEALLIREKLPATLAMAAKVQSQVYTNTIAQTFKQGSLPLDANWYINEKKQTGDYTYTREYATTLPFDAEFIAGTQTTNDSTFAVSFRSWAYSRISIYPPGSGSCGATTCHTTISDSLGNEFGAHRLELGYRLVVYPPVTASISGPGSITLAAPQTWSASAIGGNGTYAYQWERSVNQASWTPVGTQQTYTESVDTGTYIFYLRVTATSIGKQGSATKTVSVDAREHLLTVGISGPTGIESAGTKTWTAVASGGNGTFSYEWERRIDHSTYTCVYETEFGYVGSGDDYSEYISANDYDFRLRVTVTSGTQSVSEEIAVYPFESQDPICPERPLLAPTRQ